jgi:hypothetical protein
LPPPAFNEFRDLQKKLASGEAKLLPVEPSSAPARNRGVFSGPGAPTSSREFSGEEWEGEEKSTRASRTRRSSFVDVINGAARSVKGAVDSTGRAVAEALP